MRKYIAPEMEIVNFKAVDILTVSGNEPTTITGSSTAAELTADGAIQFSKDGSFDN